MDWPGLVGVEDEDEDVLVLELVVFEVVELVFDVVELGFEVVVHGDPRAWIASTQVPCAILNPFLQTEGCAGQQLVRILRSSVQ